MAKSDFVPLFNGKNLTGWRPQKQNAGNWRVENGVLIGDGRDGKMGHLTTEKTQPKDFHLRVEARVGAKGTTGIRFRNPIDSNYGYSSQFVYLNDRLQVGSLGMQTATIARGFPRAVEPIVEFGQWFTLEIIAQGATWW